MSTAIAIIVAVSVLALAGCLRWQTAQTTATGQDFAGHRTSENGSAT
jgi:hypothetical protein